jgi:hypothetical protein
MRIRYCWPLPALALVVLLNGCHGSDLVNVTGKLTYKGKPVPHTYVIFHPAEEGKRASQGLTDDNGNFTLTHSREETGVLLGQHTVTLKAHHTMSPEAAKEFKAILEKYSDPKTSGLKFEITGSGQFVDIKVPD